MKKLNALFMVFLLIFTFTISGCQDKNAEPDIDDKTVFEDDLQSLSEEELEALEGTAASDEEMTVLDEEEQDALKDADTNTDANEDAGTDSEDTDAESGLQVEKDGSYTSKEDVAVYVHTYGHLPSNYITKKEAKKLGWVSSKGNLDDVAPGKSIGGDKFGNYDNMLPVEKGRQYYECDIDYDGGYRAEKRLIYSDDGLVFYTSDHYETFEQLY